MQQRATYKFLSTTIFKVVLKNHTLERIRENLEVSICKNCHKIHIAENLKLNENFSSDSKYLLPNHCSPVFII